MGFEAQNKGKSSIEQYMVWWVVRGFAQLPSVNFGEAFSPVVKPVMTRIVLTLT
jgi:hypothetical protein